MLAILCAELKAVDATPDNLFLALFRPSGSSVHCEYEVCRGVYQRYGEVEFARRTDLFCIFDETAIQRF